MDKYKRQRNYQIRNKDKLSQYYKSYYEKNKKRISQYYKSHYEKHREENIKYQKEYNQKRKNIIKNVIIDEPYDNILEIV